VQIVRYDFAELASFKEAAREFLVSLGGRTLDIAEQRNRPEVGVESAEQMEPMRAALVGAGIPPDAFEVTLGSVFTADDDLTAQVFPPAPAGVRIARPGSGGCSMGPNVSVDGFFGFFVTASHCTAGVGTSGVEFYQPSNTVTPIVFGTEFLDPLSDPFLPGCPSGVDCRRADVAVIQHAFASGTDFWSIAQPIDSLGQHSSSTTGIFKPRGGRGSRSPRRATNHHHLSLPSGLSTR
jgi:hypothetical protein